MVLSKIALLINKIISGNRTNNIVWLVSEKAFRLVVAITIGAWTARYLGPISFGKFNYSFAFVALFAGVASLGLDALIVRDLVSTNSNKNNIIATAFFIRLISGWIAFISSILFAAIYQGVNSEYISLIVICATPFLLQFLEIGDIWFQSNVNSRPVVICKFTALIVGSIIRVALIALKADLFTFVLTNAIELMLGYIFVAYSYKRYSRSVFLSWRNIDFKIAFNWLKEGWPYLLSSTAIMLYLRLDQIMLQHMLGANAVGQYSAALRLSEIWYFFPVVIVNTFAPGL